MRWIEGERAAAAEIVFYRTRYRERIMPIRSGRFKSLISPGNAGEPPVIASTPMKIIAVGNSSARTDSFYRVLNSGEKPFEIVLDNGLEHEVKPTESLDVALKKGTVEIKFTPGEPVEGVYDFLSVFHETRSGRFRLPNGASHLIIDARHSKNGAFYRIYNSSDAEIKVATDEVGSANGTIVDKIHPHQSFDVRVEKTEIYVMAATSGEAIEGAYEYLGE